MGLHRVKMLEELLKCTREGCPGIDKEKGPIEQRTGNWILWPEDAEAGPMTHEKCECD